jgi:2-polyprenyl-3-methyl-5-hydroxy-6-metoxy-1,4-benzoquinol methylase
VATTEPGRAYGYANAAPSHSQSYLRAPLVRILDSRTWPTAARALDYGCGNGWFANWIAERGFVASGVDISESGIAIARQNFPDVSFTTNVSGESLARLGPFDLVTCIEVIAHCYKPMEELGRIHASLKPGGVLIVSTPYHGYLKYLALAASGRMETYLDTAWAGAYMHHFSLASMSKLLVDAGFTDLNVVRAGRIAPLAKSMILTCRKPPA